MTFKTKPKQKTPQIEVDLTGEEGNVFYLIALARKLGSFQFPVGYKVRYHKHRYLHKFCLFALSLWIFCLHFN